MASLLDLLKILSDHNVPFIVVGGFACTVHGVTLVTQDMDICCPMTTENLLKIQMAFKDLHPVHRMTPQRIPLQLTPKNADQFNNLYLDTDIGVIDILGNISGVGSFEIANQHSLSLDLDGYTFQILSIDALIDSKKALNRPRDILAIKELEIIKHKTQKK